MWRMQELQNAHKDSEGQVPRTVEVELREDLVDSCTAGDIVTVVGIVKALNTETVPGAQAQFKECLDSASASRNSDEYGSTQLCAIHLEQNLHGSLTIVECFAGTDKGKQTKALFLLYLDAISLEANRNIAARHHDASTSGRQAPICPACLHPAHLRFLG